MIGQIIIFKIQDQIKVITKVTEVAKLFSDDKNKQECFLDFSKENQLKWCKNNISRSSIEKINYKVVK